MVVRSTDGESLEIICQRDAADIGPKSGLNFLGNLLPPVFRGKDDVYKDAGMRMRHSARHHRDA